MNYPIAGSFRFPKIEHAAIVAGPEDIALHALTVCPACIPGIVDESKAGCPHLSRFLRKVGESDDGRRMVRYRGIPVGKNRISPG